MKHKLILFALTSALLFTCVTARVARGQTTPPSTSPPVVLPTSPIPFKYVAPESASADQPPLEGTYDVALTAKGEDGAIALTLTIKRVGEKFTAQSTDSEYISVTGIKLDGEDVTLTAAFQGYPFDMVGRFKDGGMTGTWQGGPKEGTWSAKRRQEK